MTEGGGQGTPHGGRGRPAGMRSRPPGSHWSCVPRPTGRRAGRLCSLSALQFGGCPLRYPEAQRVSPQPHPVYSELVLPGLCLLVSMTAPNSYFPQEPALASSLGDHRACDRVMTVSLPATLSSAPESKEVAFLSPRCLALQQVHGKCLQNDCQPKKHLLFYCKSNG